MTAAPLYVLAKVYAPNKFSLGASVKWVWNRGGTHPFCTDNLEEAIAFAQKKMDHVSDRTLAGIAVMSVGTGAEQMAHCVEGKKYTIKWHNGKFAVAKKENKHENSK